MKTLYISSLILAIGLATMPVQATPGGSSYFGWKLINSASDWQPRAGLQAISKGKALYIMGGRTPISPNINPLPGASIIHGDVWRSYDRGLTWTQIHDTSATISWPSRAYFQAVRKGKYMFLMGGQNYKIATNPGPGPPLISQSDFFDDVWASKDGIHWTELTDSAGWAGRAGLSAVTYKGRIYVMGGSFNDDPAIIGGPPTRVYFNDVWSSADGVHWVQETDRASWSPRAGATAVVKNGYMYLIGGEDGFVCSPLPFCDPPYFNDVWRSKDGAHWELVTDSADWAKRPGHQTVVYKNRFVLFGGFGLLANPMDVWISKNGANWKQISSSPWNAVAPTQIKYDFDAVVAGRGWGKAIYTFGGDRETFDFADTTNYLNVDNDVWRYRPAWWKLNTANKTQPVLAEEGSLPLIAYPNPFEGSTTIRYELDKPSSVQLTITDLTGRRIATLVDEMQEAGVHTSEWKSSDAASTADGFYIYRLEVEGEVTTGKLIRLE